MEFLLENIDYVITDDGVREHQDIAIHNGVIASITPHRSGSEPEHAVDSTTTTTGKRGAAHTSRIDGRGKAALAGFKNAHTHAAMTLLRGYGDDMRLQPWLQNRIWPAEAQLTAEDIYWGTRLAALEMIRSGTTFANDMYFQTPEVMRAFEDAGMRAAVGYALFDFGDPERRSTLQAEVEAMLADQNSRENEPPAGTPAGAPVPVFPTIAPHSIYTCSGEILQWAADIATRNDLLFHTHMNETEQEVSDCLAAHGVRPFALLRDLGVLEKVGERMTVAHAIWLDEEEQDLVARYGVTVVHNPASNMKLASGCFPWAEYARRNTPVMLAPDGVASNNNLDMFDEMKLAALLQKHHFGDPTRLPAEEILAIATGARSEVFARHGVGGAITAGGPADLILVDLDHPQMVPVHNVRSNLVYAANGSVVDTVICNGKLLMEERTVPGEAEVLREARRCAAALVRRAEG